MLLVVVVDVVVERGVDVVVLDCCRDLAWAALVTVDAIVDVTTDAIVETTVCVLLVGMDAVTDVLGVIDAKVDVVTGVGWIVTDDDGILIDVGVACDTVVILN